MVRSEVMVSSGKTLVGSKVLLVCNAFFNRLSWTARPLLHPLRAMLWVKPNYFELLHLNDTF